MDATHNLSIGTSLNTNNITAGLNKITAEFKEFTNALKQTDKVTTQNTSSTKELDRAEKELQQEIDQLNKKLKESQNLISKKDAEISKLNKKLKDQGKVTNDATKANDSWLSSYSKTIKIAIKSTALWGLATTAIYGTKKVLEEIAEVIKEVDTEMVNLQKVMDATITNFEEMRNVAGELGGDFAKSMTDVLKIMVEWGRQGRDQLEVIELTKAALLASNATEIQAADSVKYLTSALLQFNIPVSQAVSVVDKLNEVSNRTAANAIDLAESIKESGSAAASAGVSIDQLNGLTAALVEATAKSGNRIGNALKTIFSRMRVGGAEGSEAVSAVEVELGKVDIALRKSQFEYRDTFDVLSDLAEKWDTLNGVQKENIAFAMSGRRRYSDLKALISNFDKAVEGTSYSVNSLNSSVDENNRYLESLEAYINRSKEAFQDFSTTIGESGGLISLKNYYEMLKNIYIAMDDIVVGVNSFVETIKGFGESLEYIGAAVLGFGGSWLASIFPGATIVGGTLAGIISSIQKHGEYTKILKREKKAAEELNKALESNNELNELQISSYHSLIDKEIESVNKAQELFEITQESAIDDYIDNWVKMFPGLKKSGDELKDKFTFLKDDYHIIIDGLREFAKEKFPDIFAIENEELFLVKLEHALMETKIKISDLKKVVPDATNDMQKFKTAIENVDITLQDPRDSFEKIKESVQNIPTDANSSLGVLGLSYGGIEKYEEQIKILKNSRKQYIEFLEDLKQLSSTVSSKEELEKRIKLDINFDALTQLQQEEIINAIRSMQNIDLKTEIDDLVKWITYDYINELEEQIEQREIKIDLKELGSLEVQNIGRDLSQTEIEGALSTAKNLLSRFEGEWINLTKEEVSRLKHYKENVFEPELKSLFEFEQLENVADYFYDLADIDFWEKPILNLLNTRSAKSNVLEKSIKSAFDSFMNKEIDIDKIENYIKELENLPDIIDYKNRVNPEVDLWTLLGLGSKEEFEKQTEQLIRSLEVGKEELNRWVEDAKRIAETRTDFLTRMSDYISIDISDMGLEGLKEHLLLGKDLTKEAKNLLKINILNVEENDLIFQKAVRVREVYEDLVDTNKEWAETLKLITGFNIGDIIGINQATDAIGELNRLLLNINNKDVQKLLSELDIEEEDIEEIIKALKKHIEDTELSWHEAISNGLSNAIEQFDEYTTFADRLGLCIREVLSEVFKDEQLKKDFQSLLGKGIEGENINIPGLNLSEKLQESIMSAASAYSSGGSIGKSIFSGIGNYIAGPIGGAIGSFVGGIGESLWGGVSGEKYIDSVNKVNSGINNAQEALKEYGITMDATKAKLEDVASWWTKLWGGHDYRAYGLDKANESLEEMENALGRLQNSANTIGSGLVDSIKNAFNYQDFKLSFEQSIGQAIQDAVISKLIETKLIEEDINELAGYIEKAFSDGFLDTGEIDFINKMKDALLLSGEEIRQFLDMLEEQFDFDINQNIDSNQTFQAGNTTSIVYHQQFIVESMAFAGNRSEAEAFAEMMEPYIREVIERNQGG